jgi:hypothetical protein
VHSGRERKEMKCFSAGLRKKTKNKKATLQVRNRRSCSVFRNALQKIRLSNRTPCHASLTLEAALVLPLFLFAMALLILPLRMMDTARKMQSVAESVCKDAAIYAYTVDRLKNSGKTVKEESGKEENEGVETIKGFLAGNALGFYAAKVAKEKAGDAHIKNLLSLRSMCMDENDVITITLDYRYALPFSVFGLSSVPQTVTASHRAWIGKEPEKTSPDKENEEEDEDEDEIVYVGKSSTRYHLSRTCHYLYNDFKAVPFSSVSLERNAGGGRYHACQRCAAGVKSGTVYILPSGTAYHADKNCSAITASVRAVKKSTVEYLGACSYCGGK